MIRKIFPINLIESRLKSLKTKWLGDDCSGQLGYDYPLAYCYSPQLLPILSSFQMIFKIVERVTVYMRKDIQGPS